jgi:hypothetical protein
VPASFQNIVETGEIGGRLRGKMHDGTEFAVTINGF